MNIFLHDKFLPSIILLVLCVVTYTYYPAIGETDMVEASKGFAFVLVSLFSTGCLILWLIINRLKIRVSPVLLKPVIFSVTLLFLAWFFSIEKSEALVGYAFESNSIVGVVSGILLTLFTSVVVVHGYFRFVLTSIFLVFGSWYVIGLGLLFLNKNFFILDFFESKEGIFISASLLILLSLYHLASVLNGSVMYWVSIVILIPNLYIVGQLSETRMLIILLVPMVMFTVGRLWVPIFAKKQFSMPVWPIIAIVLLILFTQFSPRNFSELTTTHFHSTTPSLSETYTVMARLITNDVKPMLIGFGPGTFSYAWDMYRPEETNYSQYWNSTFHYGASQLLTIGVEFGLVGILAFFYVVSSLFSGYFQKLKSMKLVFLTPDDSLVGCLLIFILLTVSLLPATALVFMIATLLMGVIAGYLGYIQLIPKTYSWKNLVTFSILGILLSCVALVSVSNWRSVIFYERSAIAVDDDIGGAHLLAESAVSAYPKAQYYRSLSQLQQKQINQLINKEGEITDTDRTALRLLIALALANAETATESDSNNFLNWIVLGNIYKTLTLLGADDVYWDSYKSFEKAISLAPISPLPLFSRAELLLIAGNREDAISDLRNSLTLKADFIPARDLLVEYYSDIDTF